MARRSACRQDLPLDVVEEILLKLPVKHVARCKFLSKACYALIRTPAFINKHMRLHRSLENTNIVLAPSTTNYFHHEIVSLLPSPSYVYVPCIPEYNKFLYLVGSCNGLLCAVIKDSQNTSNFLLWNPATGEHVILPPPKLRRQGFLGTGPADMDDGENAVGFGYDARNCDYKLVKIWRGNESSYLEFWSMKTNSWRELAIQEQTLRGEVTGLSVGRRLYWLRGTLREDGFQDYVLESFDMVSGSFRTEAALPDDVVARYGDNYRVVNIIDFMGSLACSVVHGAKYDIWMMEDGDDNLSWTKRFSIGPFPGRVDFTRISIRGRFLMKKEHIGVGFNKYFLYDPFDDEDEVQELTTEPLITEANISSLRPWSSVESLVTPLMLFNS